MCDVPVAQTPMERKLDVIATEPLQVECTIVPAVSNSLPTYDFGDLARSCFYVVIHARITGSGGSTSLVIQPIASNRTRGPLPP